MGFGSAYGNGSRWVGLFRCIHDPVGGVGHVDRPISRLAGLPGHPQHLARLEIGATSLAELDAQVAAVVTDDDHVLAGLVGVFDLADPTFDGGQVSRKQAVHRDDARRRIGVFVLVERS